MENNIKKKNIFNFFINNYKKDKFSSIQYAKKAYNKLSELTVKGVALTDDQKLNLQELINNPKDDNNNFCKICSILTYGQLLWTGWCYPIRL